MKASIRALVLITIFVFPVTVRAALRMNDFAYGLRLTAPEKSGLVRVVLPETVYRHLARSDAGDIGVFRMDGRSVPYLLGPPPTTDASVPPRNLPLSPLYDEVPVEGSPQVDLRTESSSAVIGPAGTPDIGDKKAAPAYLIDHSGLSRGIERLILTWHRNRPNVLVKARLEASQDRTDWQPLVSEVTLSDIRYGEQRLVNQTIILPDGREQGRYFKLSWISGADAVALEAVEGVPILQSQRPPRRWTRAAYRSDRQAPGSMQFDSGGWFPVDEVDLQLAQGNGMVFGTFQSRDSERSVWRIHHQGLFYQLEWDKQTLRNPPVTVPETSDRYWKLDIDLRRSSLGINVPRLMLGWRPQALFFMAERGGAYLLAYGSRTAQPLPPPADLKDALAAAGNQIATLHIGPGIRLGGSLRPKTASPRHSGRMVSLSSLLLGCVLLLAFFAWWMVRRMLKIDARPFR